MLKTDRMATYSAIRENISPACTAGRRFLDVAWQDLCGNRRLRRSGRFGVRMSDADVLFPTTNASIR
jgi:hypothetical protein